MAEVPLMPDLVAPLAAQPGTALPARTPHGRTLRQVRLGLPAGSPGEAWCRALVEPMLDAIDAMHRQGVQHGAISPDSILMLDNGHAVLLGSVVGGPAPAPTAEPNFTPIEQSLDAASLNQGAWTDLYALAATAYFLLTGQAPMPAGARAQRDELVPLARLNPAGCSTNFLQAVDWAMAVQPQERPHSVARWREALAGRLPAPWLPQPAEPAAACGTGPSVALTSATASVVATAPADASLAGTANPTATATLGNPAIASNAAQAAEPVDVDAGAPAPMFAPGGRRPTQDRSPVLPAQRPSLLPQAHRVSGRPPARRWPLLLLATAGLALAAAMGWVAGAKREVSVDVAPATVHPAASSTAHDPRAHEREREGRDRERDSAAAPTARTSVALAVVLPVALPLTLPGTLPGTLPNNLPNNLPLAC